MPRDEIEPMVPVMPEDDATETVRADGGEASSEGPGVPRVAHAAPPRENHASRASSDVSSDGGRRKRFDASDVAAPLVPDLR